MFAYVIEGEKEYNLILRRLQIDKQDVTLALKKKLLYIQATQTRVQSQEGKRPLSILQCIGAEAYQIQQKRSRKDLSVQVFAALIRDIKKALKKAKKALVDPQTVLLQYLQSKYKTFIKEEADKLLLHYRLAINYAINLVRKDSKLAEIPQGLLYRMLKEELLVLQQELTSYLDYRFICVSKSPASALVLFVKKLGSRLQFCVNYQSLNAITKKDCYPLPLIQETLRQILEAKQFTKVNIIQAFYKI